jgi:hypothetical protein
MGSKKHFKILNQSGQSTVEYILLLVVVVTFITTVFNSRAFKEFFGDDSAFFTAIAEGLRTNYRYSTVVPLSDDIGLAPVREHPSFYSSEDSTSRFFTFNSGGQPYPTN